MSATRNRKPTPAVWAPIARIAAHLDRLGAGYKLVLEPSYSSRGKPSTSWIAGIVDKHDTVQTCGPHQLGVMANTAGEALELLAMRCPQ